MISRHADVEARISGMTVDYAILLKLRMFILGDTTGNLGPDMMMGKMIQLLFPLILWHP